MTAQVHSKLNPRIKPWRSLHLSPGTEMCLGPIKEPLPNHLRKTVNTLATGVPEIRTWPPNT